MITCTILNIFFVTEIAAPLDCNNGGVRVLEVKHIAYPLKRQFLDLNPLLMYSILFVNSVVSVDSLTPSMLVISDAMELLFCTR